MRNHSQPVACTGHRNGAQFATRTSLAWRQWGRMFAMSTARKLIGILTAAATLSCCAETNDLEKAIALFPEINARDYRPDEAVRAANILIQAGQDAACSALEASVRKRRERRKAFVGFDDELSRQEDAMNRTVCQLCRLLFTQTNLNEPLRPPRIGALSGVPYETMKPPDWPHLPFVIIQGIPLSVSLGYAGAGVPERAEQYLSYCKANGNFRSQLFSSPTSITASNALSSVFNSQAWKALKWKDEGLGWHYAHDEESTKRALWKQVENMANQVQRTGASGSADETNRAPAAAGPRR
jgi:hypothetical protein